MDLIDAKIEELKKQIADLKQEKKKNALVDVKHGMFMLL